MTYNKKAMDTAYQLLGQLIDELPIMADFDTTHGITAYNAVNTILIDAYNNLNEQQIEAANSEA